MFDGLLPTSVSWATATPSMLDGGASLIGTERDALVHAVPARASEFEAGRAAAREALGQLGIDAVEIPVSATRAPVWPDGIVGSITHCDGLAAAAVARTADILSIGIDAEPARPLDPDVLEVVVTDRERRGLTDDLCATVLFSAKESFYKCWSSAGGRLLEFDEVEVELRADHHAADDRDVTGQLTASPVDGGTWHGRWAIRDGLVLTAVWTGPRSDIRTDGNDT